MAKKVKGTKGNVPVKKRSFTKSGESWFDLCLLCAYLVQSRGQANTNEVYEDIVKLGAKVMAKTCSDAMNALQKANVLAMSADADGTKTYHMRRYNFTKNPEMAQVDKLIEELRTDMAGELILVQLQKPGGKPKGSPWPTEPVTYKVEGELTTPALGGHIWGDNPGLQHAYYRNGKNLTLHMENGKELRDGQGNLLFAKKFTDHTEVPHMFGRINGALEIMHVGCVKGSLVNAATMAPPQGEGRVIKTTDMQKFLSTSNVMLDGDGLDLLPHGGDYDKLPVQRLDTGPANKGSSAGPQRYESIPPGTHIEFEITCPSKDFIKPEDMVQWLRLALPRLPRGMSHARGAQGHGRMDLVRVQIMSWSNPDTGFQPLWEREEDGVTGSLEGSVLADLDVVPEKV
jgi:hypothetical protein